VWGYVTFTIASHSLGAKSFASGTNASTSANNSRQARWSQVSGCPHVNRQTEESEACLLFERDAKVHSDNKQTLLCE
jgi:hypothetical protein